MMVFSEIRLALRTLARNRGFAAASILTLAFGIVLNIAMFGVVNAIWFRPLPLRDPQSLTILEEVNTREGVVEGVSAPAYRALASGRNPLIAGAAAFTERPANLRDQNGAERVHAGLMTAGGFALLGVRTVVGRPFTSAEEAQEAPVMLLSERLWRERFQADPGAVGREVKVDGKNAVIVGVLPAEFRFQYAGYDILLPLPPTALRGAAHERGLQALARRNPGVSPSQLSEGLRAFHSGSEPGWTLAARDYRESFLARHSQYLSLPAAAALVLLVVCASISNLFLAKAMVRRKETAIRMALGATRAGVVRPIVVEAMVVALLGGALATVLAVWLRQVAVAATVELRWFTLDWRVFAYTLLLTALAGLCFGVAPALAVARSGAAGALRAGARMRGALVAAELALAVVLLAGAGVLLRAAASLHVVDAGFSTSGLLAAQVSLEGPRYESPAARDRFRREMAARLSAPSAWAGGHPLANGAYPVAIETDGRDAGALRVALTYGDERYAELLGLRLMAGRGFTAADASAGAPGIAIVNRDLANRLWPGQPPESVLGRSLRIGQARQDARVVGIMESVRQNLLEDPAPEILRPLAQSPAASATLLVRSAAGEQAAAEQIRGALRAVDPELPVPGVATMEGVISNAYPEALMIALSAFAAVALSLAAVGLYGIMSFLVATQRRELGIRMALGAEPRAIVGFVLRRSLRIAAGGAASGIAAALAVGRLLAGVLPGVRPADPLVLAAVALLTTAVAMAAALGPSWRASRLDPMESLRHAG